MSIKDSLEGSIIGKVLKNLQASEPVTTLLGFVLAGIVAAKVDYGKLLNKDPDQIANLVSAVVIAVMGYYTNHGKLTQKAAIANLINNGPLPQTAAKSLVDSGGAVKFTDQHGEWIILTAALPETTGESGSMRPTTKGSADSGSAEK